MNVVSVYDTASCRLPIYQIFTSITQNVSSLLFEFEFAISQTQNGFRVTTNDQVRRPKILVQFTDTTSKLMWVSTIFLFGPTKSINSIVYTVITPSLWRWLPRVQSRWQNDTVLTKISANLGPPAVEMRTPLRFLKEAGRGH